MGPALAASPAALAQNALTATATDGGGATATSAPVVVLVDAGTAIVITSPAEGRAASVVGAFTVTGTLEGPAGSTGTPGEFAIKRVTYPSGGSGEDVARPWSRPRNPRAILA